MVAQLTAEGAYASATKKQQEEIRDAYEAYYKQQMGSTGGYQQGLQTIAPLTADQLAANQGLRGLVGSQDALRQEGVDLTRGTTRQYTPSGKPIEEYMSPYLRTALDAQKQQAQRQYERTSVPQFEAQAVAAGGMSGLGSRAGVEAAERATGQNMLLANIEASGQQKAYEAAVEAQLQDQKQDQMMFKNQLARETDAAAALGASASNIYKGKASEYGLLSQMGKEGQQFDERNLEDAERRRLEEYNFPLQQLNTYAGGIAGVTPNRNQAQIVPKQGGPSWGRIAGSLAAKYIAPKVADWFGSYFGKAGGQIPSPPELYQYRANGGQVFNPYEAERAAAAAQQASSQGVTSPPAPIAPAQFQNNFLEKTNSPPMYNNTVAQPLGGLSSTMQAQPFMNISREGGGPVMPPMYYRAVGGQTAPMMNPTMMDQAQAQPLGGLSSTPQAQPFGNMFTRQAGGPVMPPMVYRQVSGQVDNPNEITANQLEIGMMNDPALRALYERELNTGRPTEEEMIAQRKVLLEEQNRKAQERMLSRASPRKKAEIAKRTALELGGVEPAATKDSKEVQGGQYTENEAALAMANDEAANTSGLAFKEQTLKNAIGTAKTQGPDAIETLRNAYKKYDETMKGTVETSAARTQAFWDQIGLAIARPGDLKTNLVEGFAKGQDTLAAMDKEKKAQTRASAGRELSTEEKVANILASRSKTRQEMLKELAKTRITASAAQRAAITKQMNVLRGKAYTAFEKMKDSALKSLMKKGLEAGKGRQKSAKLDALNEIDPDMIKNDIRTLMIAYNGNQSKAIKIYTDRLIGN